MGAGAVKAIPDSMTLDECKQLNAGKFDVDVEAKVRLPHVRLQADNCYELVQYIREG